MSSQERDKMEAYQDAIKQALEHAYSLCGYSDEHTYGVEIKGNFFGSNISVAIKVSSEVKKNDEAPL